MKILFCVFLSFFFLLLYSFDWTDIEHQDCFSTKKYNVIDLCNGNTISLPIEFGFTTLDVKFLDECVYTARDSNDILLMVSQSRDTLNNSINSFVEKQQISNRAIYGNVVFSRIEINFFQDKLTFSYSAERVGLEEGGGFFMKTFYSVIDVEKRTFIRFHFVVNNSKAEMKDVLLKKASNLLSSYKASNRTNSR